MVDGVLVPKISVLPMVIVGFATPSSSVSYNFIRVPLWNRYPITTVPKKESNVS